MQRFMIISAFLILATLSLSPAAQAQSRRDVPNVFFDTVRTGEVQPIALAVEDIKPILGADFRSDDLVALHDMVDIIRHDIDFYADFQIVTADSFYLKMYEIKEVDLLAWERLGAQFVIRLEAEPAGGSVRVNWKILKTIGGDEFSKGTETGTLSSWRELAHDVSNALAKALTGDRGIFRTQICYIRKIGKGAKEIFVADYDGANERQVTHTGSINVSPCWTPDGKEIYFTSFKNGDPQLYRVDVASGKIAKIGNYAGLMAAPAVSPDGTKIAIVMFIAGNSEIYILDTSGRIILRLTNNTSIDTSPTWGPGGKQIAFASDRSGAPQIFICDVDGNNTHRLTYQGDYNDSPIWSARGDRITFVSRTETGRFDLASIDTSGAKYRVMTQIGMNENPHFSPDGKHLIFASDRLRTGDIYTATVTGGKQRRLTRTGDCSNPAWGPLK
jgi:TolB protein